MMTQWILVVLFLRAFPAPAEIQVDVELNSLPPFWLYAEMPILHTTMISLEDSMGHTVQTDPMGPAGEPMALQFRIQADSLFPQGAMITRLDLRFFCLGEIGSHLDFAPYEWIYTPGFALPPLAPTVFPFDTLSVICPPRVDNLDEVLLAENRSYAFFRLSTRFTWPEAKGLAEWLEKDLVRIDTEAENSALSGFIAGTGLTPAWLGLSDEETEGEWVWQDGSPPAYTNWAEGEPGSSPIPLDHAVLQVDGLWRPWPGPKARVLLEWELGLDVDISIIGPWLHLHWQVEGEPAPGQAFVIHSSQHPWFTPNASTRVGYTLESSYTIAPEELEDGRRWFQVRVETIE